MAERNQMPQSRKRKRRRQDKPSITARLVLDGHVKGDIGILSEDLFADLFPALAQAQEDDNGTSDYTEIHHVAICPWGPSNAIEDSTWTVVPVTPSSALAHSTVQFSPSSLALQSFAEVLQKIAPSKISSHSRSGIEIRILDVIPLPLETVFVTVEAELARRLENGEGTFHGEHTRTNGWVNGKPLPKLPEDRLTAAIREALGALNVVHTGDIFSLPLPPHPITHVPLPPAKVTLCEPVGQGILSLKSKIIITKTNHHGKSVRKVTPLPANHTSNGFGDDDEDTSNDQFFSAAEDRYKTDATFEDEGSETETGTDISEGDNDNLSDDSMEDMISLQAPMLPSHNASGISTIQPGTPRTIGRGRTNDGIRTPGSVFSNFTTTTARGGGQKGRLFKVQGLVKSLPEETLHPKPNANDDEEARVFVDINSLTKVGCFSGDWVRLEAAAEPPSQGAGLWGLGSFGEVQEEEVWRPVKVFGIPESYSHRPVTKIPSHKHEGRRLSFFDSQIQKPSSPTVYLSPILLANMENTPYCRLSPLKRLVQPGKLSQPKITPASRPPFALELTLSKISTPFSTERALQNALFAGLKRHFTTRTRIVRKGDLVAVPIDGDLGRTLGQAAPGDDLEVDDLLTNTTLDNPRPSKPGKVTGVAWFKVGHVGVSKEIPENVDEEDFWGGVASVDASNTHLLASGSEIGRLPSTTDSSWEYYLGLKSRSRSETDLTTMSELRHQFVSPLQRRLRELIAAATSPRAIHLRLQPLAILLISTQRNIGKATLASRACSDIGLHIFPIDAYDVVGEGGTDLKTFGLETQAQRGLSCGPEFCALLIRHIEALTADKMLGTLKEIVANSRVLIATTTEVDKISDGIRGLFTQELEMSAPDEEEREGILRNIVDNQSVSLAPDVDLGAVAVKTAALVAGDLVDVVDRALVARKSRLETLASSSISASFETGTVTVRDVLIAGGPAGRCLAKQDLDVAVEAARKNFADAIGAPKIPNVGWDDVGGLSHVKDTVMETIQLPLERPELFAKGMKKRSGILFYGPPGTGKTLLAKAIATEFSLNFFSVKGPELLNMYIGESEANVRRVFQRARDARPCVVFFDELDSVAPKRGNQGDSGGVMDRIVSQLLAELDGMSDDGHAGGGVFVIGATNRPDLLDEALLRPGRFDKMVYLGVSDTHEKQVRIMEALTRKFSLHPSLSLERIAARLPFTYTGADFYALCSDAMLKAVTRQAELVDGKIAKINRENVGQGKSAISTAYFFDHYAGEDDLRVLVEEDDFWAAERELIPSVSAAELQHYQTVRAQFEKPEQKPDRPNTAFSAATVPLEEKRPRSNGKGMGKERERVVSGKGKGKGKEKAGSVGGWDDGYEDEDEDEGGLALDHGSNGWDGETGTSGAGKRNGKGKEREGTVDMGFQEGGVEEEEGLY